MHHAAVTGTCHERFPKCTPQFRVNRRKHSKIACHERALVWDCLTRTRRSHHHTAINFNRCWLAGSAFRHSLSETEKFVRLIQWGISFIFNIHHSLQLFRVPCLPSFIEFKSPSMLRIFARNSRASTHAIVDESQFSALFNIIVVLHFGTVKWGNFEHWR